MMAGEILLAGVIGLAAIALLRRFTKPRATMSKKPTTRLNLNLDTDEYEVLRDWAARNDLSLSDYVRKTLNDSIPAEVRVKEATSQIVTDVMEKAFGLLDEAENESTAPGVIGLPPARRPIPGVVTEAERTHPQQRVVRVEHVSLPTVQPGWHPCAYLSQTVPHHLKGQCNGICEHREQFGRPCHWAPTVAHNCEYFYAKADVAARQP